MFKPGDRVKIVRLNKGDTGSGYAMKNMHKTFIIDKICSSRNNSKFDYVTVVGATTCGVWFTEIEKVSSVYLSNQGTEINV